MYQPKECGSHLISHRKPLEVSTSVFKNDCQSKTQRKKHLENEKNLHFIRGQESHASELPAGVLISKLQSHPHVTVSFPIAGTHYQTPLIWRRCLICSRFAGFSQGWMAVRHRERQHGRRAWCNKAVQLIVAKKQRSKGKERGKTKCDASRWVLHQSLEGRGRLQNQSSAPFQA